MALDSLRDLFMVELRDLYSAESQALKALPLLLRGAGAPGLRKLLQRHVEQTEGQLRRLEASFAWLGASPHGRRSVGMEGLLDQARALLTERGPASVVDAGLIAVMQRIEGYKIAAYDNARIYATLLGESDVAELLAQSVHEGQYMDAALTSLADSGVHERAAGAVAVAGVS